MLCLFNMYFEILKILLKNYMSCVIHVHTFINWVLLLYCVDLFFQSFKIIFY